MDTQEAVRRLTASVGGREATYRAGCECRACRDTETLRVVLRALEEAQARLRELEQEFEAEAHRIYMLLGGPPREGLTLPQEIRARYEEQQAALEEAQAAIDEACAMFDPMKPKGSPGLLTALARGLKQAFADLRAERDQLKADLAAEREGTLALRAESGAREDETFPDFVRRLRRALEEAQTDIDEALAKVDHMEADALALHAALDADERKVRRLEEALARVIKAARQYALTPPERQGRIHAWLMETLKEAEALASAPEPAPCDPQPFRNPGLVGKTRTEPHQGFVTFRLPMLSDPDDGMYVVDAGVIDGYGTRKAAIIWEGYRVLEPLAPEPAPAPTERVVCAGAEYGWTGEDGVPHYGVVTGIDAHGVSIRCNYHGRTCGHDRACHEVSNA